MLDLNKITLRERPGQDSCESIFPPSQEKSSTFPLFFSKTQGKASQRPIGLDIALLTFFQPKSSYHKSVVQYRLGNLLQT